MALIGNQIRQYSDRVVLDSLTASATADYTLQLNSTDFVPSSAESLTVSLNGIIQKPQDSYTVSNSTLTFASALTASDSIDFIIAERGITLQTPSAGSVNTEQLASSAVTTAKIADDAVTKDKLIAHNYPAFEAYPSGNQTLVDLTTTKVSFNSETLDTDNCFDSTTNYRFTPTVAGKYYCYSTITLATTTFPNSSMDEMRIHFYKNGTSIKRVIIDFKSNPIRYGTLDIMDTVSFNGSTDYLEVFAFIDSNTGTPMIAGSATHRPTYFGAYRIGD